MRLGAQGLWCAWCPAICPALTPEFRLCAWLGPWSPTRSSALPQELGPSLLLVRGHISSSPNSASRQLGSGFCSMSSAEVSTLFLLQALLCIPVLLTELPPCSFLHILPLSFSKPGILPFLSSPPQTQGPAWSPSWPWGPTPAAWSTDHIASRVPPLRPAQVEERLVDFCWKSLTINQMTDLPLYCPNKNSHLQSVWLPGGTAARTLTSSKLLWLAWEDS